MEGRHPWTKFAAIAKLLPGLVASSSESYDKILLLGSSSIHRGPGSGGELYRISMPLAKCNTGSQLAPPTCSSLRGVPKFVASLLPGTSLELAKGNAWERDFIDTTRRQVIFSQDFD